MTNQSAHPEHRRWTRIAFAAAAQLRAGGRELSCQLLDISLKGALVRRPSDWPARVDEPVVLELRIAPETRIRMEGRVAHLEPDRAGIACHHLDIDSAAHLRRLIELNLGDEAQLHRELAAMIAPR
jgi:hypothetical protein